MQAIRGEDTRPELALRSALHRLGLRFRVGVVVLPGTRRRADIVFAGAKVVCLVHGCFWHGCPRHRPLHKANAAYWRAKIALNVRRDRDTLARLVRAGWRVVTCWTHEDPVAAARRIERIVRGPVARASPI